LENIRELTVGDEVTGFARVASLQNWNRFAAVNCEFVDIHMDDSSGQAAGFPGAIGMGNLQWAYLHAFLRHIVRADGHIVALECRFRSPVLKGMHLEAHGRVIDVQQTEAGTVVSLSVWIADDAGTKVVEGIGKIAHGSTKESQKPGTMSQARST
jgi:acyl dehydratase